jgi:hypothetical protein
MTYGRVPVSGANEKRPRKRAFLLISALSILANTREIVGQIGASLNCLVSLGCGESDLRKGLTKEAELVAKMCS